MYAVLVNILSIFSSNIIRCFFQNTLNTAFSNVDMLLRLVPHHCAFLTNSLKLHCLDARQQVRAHQIGLLRVGSDVFHCRLMVCISAAYMETNWESLQGISGTVTTHQLYPPTVLHQQCASLKMQALYRLIFIGSLLHK